MTKQPTIKFYTQKGKSLDLRGKNKFRPGKIFKKLAGFFVSVLYFIGAALFGFVFGIKRIIFAACYKTGSLIINFFVRIYNAVKKDALKTKKAFFARLKVIQTGQFAKSILVFFIIAAVVFLGIGGGHFISGLLRVKDSAVQNAMLGNSYMTQAQDAITSQNFDLAQNKFTLALQSFNQAENQFRQTGLAVNGLLSLIPQKNQADKLLLAASLIASSGQNFISLENSAKNLHLSAAGINSEGRPTVEVFSAINNQMSQALAKLAQAKSLLAQVNPNILPASSRNNFSGLSDKLSALWEGLDNFSKIFGLAQNILTGDKNILILFENNNELRAGGGFMGTFGSLKIIDGQISKMNVSSIYDLDGQLTDVIKPPSPIFSVNDRWYLRDTNWFADFPTSAKVISTYYEKEGGETPDVIIAMTPNLIIDLLKITGPVNLPKYNVTLTPDNFIEETQAIGTISDNMPTNSPKQILADFVPVLIQKIISSDKNAWLAILQSLQDNLTGKQIVFFAKDPGLESQLANFHWTGALADSGRDYLSVVSSNLGATKTDLAIIQKINLVTTIQTDGSVTDELTITRSDPLPDLPDSHNYSFLRIYAPLGSKLISNNGFDSAIVGNQKRPDQSYKIDPDVYNWEKNAVKDVLTGTFIGQETGKTFFGNWVNLTAGGTKTLKLVYTLPFKINAIDRFSLMLQKQIGATDQNFTWTLNFAGRKMLWKNFSPDNFNTKSLDSDIMLDKDYLFGIVLQK